MQRIRSHINRSAGQHLRAVRSTSLTADQLLLNTERLHRVDASQLQAPVHVVHGKPEQREPACWGHGVGCMRDPACHDTRCEGHPCNDDGFDVPATERDAPLLRKVLAAYAAVFAFCAWSAWQWLTR